MSIGKNIKKFRLERGLTQRGLANKVGLAEITIRQYENESRTPTLKTLNIIADKLNILLSELISDDSLDSFTPEELKNFSSAKLSSITINTDTDQKAFTNSDDYKKFILEKAKETQNDIPKQNAPVDNTETATHKTIVIDDDIDKTHPINTILAKVDNHVPLKPEELEQYKNHVAKAIPSIRQSLESFAETLKQSLAKYYEAMNDEGQKEADLQIQKTIEKVTKQAENQAIDEATEKVQLLSRIPEYKKDSDA